MKEIGTISLDRMNNGAHFLFVDHIAGRAEADTKVQPKVTALITALRTAVEQENVDLKLSQKSLLTDDISAADSLRDSLYSGYKKAVSGFRNFPVDNFKQAAAVLWQHIIDYAIDPQMQLDRETGLLINFITDLEGKYASQITTLSLTPFVTGLKDANEKVSTLTASRMDEQMGRIVGALKASRKASDEAYRNLVKMVNALAMVEGDADYTAFIDYVNTEIAHYKREVLGQKATAPSTSSGSGKPSTGGGSQGGGSSSGSDVDQNENPLG